MKNLRIARFILCFVVFFSISLSNSYAAAPEQNTVVIDPSRPDFSFQSIFSEKAQNLLINQLRSVFTSEAGFDPLERHFEKPLQVRFPIKSNMGRAIKNMVEEVINTEIDSTEVIIDIEGLVVKSPNATVTLSSAHSNKNELNFDAGIRIKETVASVDRILIHFSTQPNRRTFLQKFYVELKGTTLHADSLDSLSVDIQVKTRLQPDGSIRVGLDSGVLRTFDDIDPKLLADELKLDPGTISLPPGFGIQIGRVVLPGDAKGLEEVVQRRKREIAHLLIAPLAKELREAPAKIFKNGPPYYTIPSHFEMDVPCLGNTGLRIMRYGVIGTNQLQVAFGLNHPTYHRTNHGLEYFDDATNAVFEKIDQRKSSVVIGVGYRAVAWGLKYGLDHCLKDKIPKTLQVGPQGVEVRLDEPGNGVGVFALHAQSKLKWLLRVVLGKKMVEFPLKIAPSLDYVPRTANSVPKLKLDLSDTDLSEEVLMSGYESIPSNVKQLRLKKLVLKKVRKQLQTSLGTAQLEIPLPFAMGEDLDFADLASDGFGNLNLSLSLDPDTRPEARGFWNLFSEYLKPVFSKTSLTDPAK
jgi:hypothetical protein